MEVVVLGTGSADGWPNPFCTCASCQAARRAGSLRGNSGALVDGRLLLDLGPDVPRLAEQTGRDLSDLRHVLVTHAHPDHLAPAALLWRSWTGVREPIDLVGPAAVLDACRDWIGPDDPVRLVPVTAGDRLEIGSYTVSVLRAAHGGDGSGEAVLYDVASDTGRLLWATDTGPLPDAAVTAAAGADYDVVLMEETFGSVTDHGTQHLDLATFPQQLARLRSVGAVTADTDVVAIHLSHYNPPAAELAARLAAWGARIVPDGTVVGTRATAGRLPERTLVLGGARSGKSLTAERLLAAEPDVLYVATGGRRDGDEEWARRVAAHRDRRPANWTTAETTDLVPLLQTARTPVLIDCLSLWLTAVLDEADAWTHPGDLAAVRQRIDALVAAWRRVRVPVVAVTNEVGSGVVPATASGRLFRDELGRLNAAVADASDRVLLTVAGQVLPLRGSVL